ncbi:hypothetical protein [Methanoregula sp.]|uniref:hypothetical protein n=1 Tax=Methanoregula sp. TaxID=2052170 RepID=UPI003C77A7A2
MEKPVDDFVVIHRGASFLIFSTGKIIVTGLKDLKDAEGVINNLKGVIGVK